MAIQRELGCPHCKKPLPWCGGFEHDENLNFICAACKGVVFAVTEEAEAALKKHAAASSRSHACSAMGFQGCSWFKREPVPIALIATPDGETSTVDSPCCPTTTSSDPQDNIEGLACYA